MTIKGNEYGSELKVLKADTNEMSKEEKLRLRQLKIAQWKAKKEQEKSPNPEPAAVSKIEEWKRRKAQNETPNSIHSTKPETKTQIRIKTSLGGIKKRNQSNSNIEVGIKPKRSVFGDVEDENVVVKKKLKLSKDGELITKNDVPENTVLESKKSEDKDDSLDDFMNQLKELESKSKNNGKAGNSEDSSGLNIDSIMKRYEEEDEEEEDGDDGEEDLEKLISSRIEKLQQKGKTLEVVDHENIQYHKFNKIFYSEGLELANITPEDLITLRLLLGDISVKGSDCPKPIQKWSQLGLPLALLNIISQVLQYKEPSAIQCQALPAIMSGRDFIGIAKTGSGKTLLFVLPMIRHIQGQDFIPEGDGPIAVVLAPTRELSLQIFKETTIFTKALGLRAACCCGGTPIQNQIAELKRGVDIIVGTPGRVIDLLAANSGRVTNLLRTTFVVLDEADRMFDMGFEPQVNKIFNQVRPDRQTILFLATFPKKMDFLVKKVLENPIEVTVGGRSVVAAEISQVVKLIDNDEEKFDSLLEILQDPDIDSLKTLIFVEKQTDADNLLVQLFQQGYQSQAIHGGKEQLDRKHLIKQFTKGEIPILIATSVASRGLDVKGLNLVINYDAPSHMEDYVHRVGRTGRAGAKGTAITIVRRDQERNIADLARSLNITGDPEDETLKEIVRISNEFTSKLKSGAAKISSGFGGKGLDKLQELRDNKQDLERMVYGDNDGEKVKKASASGGNKMPKFVNTGENTNKKTGKDAGSSNHESSIQFPEWNIVTGGAPETAGPDQGKYHARIAVNDLPQTARWILVSRENIAQVIEATNTSITNKGQYYPPGTNPPKPVVKNGKEIAPPPKLYLLVEGQEEKDLEKAISLLKEKMIDGLEKAAQADRSQPQGRYKV